MEAHLTWPNVDLDQPFGGIFAANCGYFQGTKTITIHFLCVDDIDVQSFEINNNVTVTTLDHVNELECNHDASIKVC